MSPGINLLLIIWFFISRNLKVGELSKISYLFFEGLYRRGSHIIQKNLDVNVGARARTASVFANHATKNETFQLSMLSCTRPRPSHDIEAVEEDTRRSYIARLGCLG